MNPLTSPNRRDTKQRKSAGRAKCDRTYDSHLRYTCSRVRRLWDALAQPRSDLPVSSAAVAIEVLVNNGFEVATRFHSHGRY